MKPSKTSYNPLSNRRIPFLSLLVLFFAPRPTSTSTIFYPQYSQPPLNNNTSFDLSACNLHIKQPFSGSCQCTALYDVRCTDVDQIPQLYTDNHNIVYNGIYLAQQKISSLQYGAFQGFQVQKVVLNLNNIGNKISSKPFFGLEKVLRELYMGGCNITTLPEHMLKEMKNLSRLHLWANKIIVITPGYFSSCSELKELILWGNKLSIIKDGLFNGLWNLQKLDLDRNEIKEIQMTAFKHLGRLEVIHLGENQIATLPPDVFTHLTNLKVLNLDGNRLKVIYPKAFEILHNLISLSLNNNNLTLLPGETFTHMRNLTAIFLHRNLLEELWPNAFQNQKSLYLLNLSYNQIKDIPDGTFRDNQHLKIFYIDNNRIETVQMCVFSWSRRHPFRMLSMLGNPLTCDCRLSWLAELQKNSSVSVGGVCERKGSAMNLGFDSLPRGFSEVADGQKITFRYSVTDSRLYRQCEPVPSKCN